jgi:hypothetical protein
MRWLLTVVPGVDRWTLQRELGPLDVVVADLTPTGLDREQVFEADGPGDLPERLTGHECSVIAVHPDSDVEPYPW